MTNVSFCAEPAFLPALDIADEIAVKYGLSRSIVFRTILTEYLGIKPANEALHQAHLQNINEALGRK